ncbi:hypothetical protein DKX38_013487 [Salix brachista]|uniref:Uncharacterized protein n=1 Tax=Salix brachista TaxID=2182728 RepID=A0A5N5LRD1_9ROSI|nr:hypothetical protein DKX38_013487 [Salix brachista]
MLWDCLAGQIPLSAGGVIDSYLWNCSRYGIYTGSSGYGGAEHLLTTSNGQTSAEEVKEKGFNPEVQMGKEPFNMHGKWHLSHYSDQGPEVHQQIQM